MSPEAAKSASPSKKSEPRELRAGALSSAMKDRGSRARMAARVTARAETGQKNSALFALAERLLAEQKTLLTANHQDLKLGKESKLEAPLMDRLELNAERVASMADGVRQVAGLPDPVGQINELHTRPSGIQVGRMRVPLGVVGIIYESRPNVTADAAALCLKSGNASILRGGSEALQFQSRHRALHCAGAERRRPAGRRRAGARYHRSQGGRRAADHAAVRRRGDPARRQVRWSSSSAETARVPVIKHLDGICHVYIDGQADLEKAIAIAVNAKTQRYGTCNTMETLLVDKEIAAKVLPELGRIYTEHRRRTARLRAHAQDPRRHQVGDRGGLAHRVPRADSLDPRGRRPRRRRSSTSPTTGRSTPIPSSPRISRVRAASCARSIRAR